MKINIVRIRKNPKYKVILSESELKEICRALNEKSEMLMAENNLNSEIHAHRLDIIIKNLSDIFSEPLLFPAAGGGGKYIYTIF